MIIRNPFSRDPFPLVSVLIPTYNQPEYFRQALESALNQDYPNIEIIVSDDSTDDRVWKVAREYQGKIQYLQHREKIPPYAFSEMFNFENLLEHAHGEYIDYLMHDDLFLPNRISKMMKIFLDDVNEEIAVVSSARYTANSKGEISMLWAPFHLLDPSGLTIMSGESAGRELILNLVNFIGELTTVIVRKKSFYSKFRAPNSQRYYTAGPYHAKISDVSVFLEAFRHGGLAFLSEPLSVFRTGLEFQDTNNIDSRLSCVASWTFFITLAYLQGFYIRSFEEFIYSVDNWTSYILPSIFSSMPDSLKFRLEPLKRSINDILPAADYAVEGRYEEFLDAVIKRLLLYPETHSLIDRYVVKNYKGLWQKKEFM